MKLINKYFAILCAVAVVFTSCDDVEDNVIDAGKPGVVTTLSGSSAALLATTDADLNIQSLDVASMTLMADVVEAGTPIAKAIVKKSFNGGEEMVVQEFNSFPFTYTVNSVAEFNDGVNPSGNLEIGDTFTYRVYVVSTDGREFTYVSSSLSVTLNCNSDIAGTYETDCNGTGGPIGPNGGRLVTVTEVEGQPGVYEVSDVSCLGFGPGQPAPICGIFTDVCSTISVSPGADDCNLGVATTGSGAVSQVGGQTVITITWENSIASSDMTYVKQ